MDHLKLADDLIRNVGGNTPPDEIAAASTMSIAAALIAIAERCPQFVQVGSRWFNLEQISSMRLGKYHSLHITFFGESEISLGVSDSTAFLTWWAEHASVVRLEVE